MKRRRSRSSFSQPSPTDPELTLASPNAIHQEDRRLYCLALAATTLAVAVDGTARLVTRVHAVYDWRHPLTALLGVILMEFGDFAMQRRMLRGIKARAESHL